MKYKIVHKLNKKQRKELYRLYKKEWWTKERKKKDIKKMLKNSDILFVLINKKEKLIGFARVLSDFVYKVEIYDVIITQKYRGKGLGDILIKAILEHKKLQNVQQFNLQCKRDMVSFYKKYNFTEQLGDLVYMRKAYKN
jgi:predicted GNAT family N-acyltransferase